MTVNTLIRSRAPARRAPVGEAATVARMADIIDEVSSRGDCVVIGDFARAGIARATADSLIERARDLFVARVKAREKARRVA
ncbi:hypothetical protein [Methylobrevis pamukkalensis]|uniref:Uncharacterized protein n=1 Tax=Methylobrevis pamukkalensis TaxID=1439726 RepID=A0A1E3GYS2_9HYPH|nr:hypothetical protein [Methylobrevis pamukkalensis]ODN69218.1 hypothetical protein A6302_03480 [Methylobrevis pamukkalensis]